MTRGAKDAARKAFAKAEVPPRWDLSAGLYAAIDDPALDADIARADRMAADFRLEYEGRVDKIEAQDLAAAIRAYEKVEDARGKVSTYLALLVSEDSVHEPATKPIYARLAKSGDALSFFEGEIAELTEPDLLARLQEPALARYAPWISGVRAGKAHYADEEISNLNGPYTENLSAWQRLYRDLMEETRIGGRTVNDVHTELLNRDLPLKQAEALRADMGAALEGRAPQVAMIYDMVVRDGLSDMTPFNYARPEQPRYVDDAIDAGTVDAMRAAARRSYPRLSHRFFQWKAARHDVETMPIAQAKLRLPENTAEGRIYGWDEARNIIVGAHARFSPRLGRIAKRLFDEKHIDAEKRDNKETCAFCMPGPPGVLPFILCEYPGLPEYVSGTLGHEVGHALHYVLAGRKQGQLLSAFSTPVSETASIFSEMLVLDEMIRGEKEPFRRQSLLLEKAEGIVINSLRSFSYHEFEVGAHAAAKAGPLSVAALDDIWTRTYKDYAGPAVAVDADSNHKHMWMLVSHFFEPFYTYSYTMAQLMAGALHKSYREAESEGPEAKAAFAAQYVEFLEAGSSKGFHDLFWTFGYDTQDPSFWDKVFSWLEEDLDRLITFDPKAASPAPAVKKGGKPKAGR